MASIEFTTSEDAQKALHLITQFVAEERERCAQIAESIDVSDQVHCAQCNDIVARAIAAKIRDSKFV